MNALPSHILLWAATCVAFVAALILARWRLSVAGAAGFLLDFIFLIPLPIGANLLYWLPVDRLPHTWVAFPAFLWWVLNITALSLTPFSILYIAARIAFSRVSKDLIDAARTLGMGEWSILWRVLVRQGWPWLAGGFVLGLARTGGLTLEATVFVCTFVLLLQLPVRFAHANGAL